jgi:hypothetical protein
VLPPEASLDCVLRDGMIESANHLFITAQFICPLGMLVRDGV